MLLPVEARADTKPSPAVCSVPVNLTNCGLKILGEGFRKFQKQNGFAECQQLFTQHLYCFRYYISNLRVI